MHLEKALIGAKVNNKYKVINCDMSNTDIMPIFLKEHYSDIEKIKKLLKLGDIVSLGKNIIKEEGITVKPFDNYTMAKMRDFQEDDCDAIIYETAEDIIKEIIKMEEVEIYIFEDDKWKTLEWQPMSLDCENFRIFFLEL